MFWLISLIIGSCLSLHVYSKESVYRDAAHFWPLDSITGIKDTVTDGKASIFGNNGVSLKGRGNGYMELKTGESALKLGEYSDTCLLTSEKCKNGAAISFWIRLQETKPNGELYDLLTLKRNDNHDLIKISLKNDQSPSLLYSGYYGVRYFNTTIKIQQGMWIHSSLVLTESGRIRFFFNGKEMEILQIKTSSKSSRFLENVAIMVGQWVKLHEFGKGYGPTIYYDEIAIFYKELDNQAIKNIVLKNFGQIQMKKECISNVTSIDVKWSAPFDTYEHLITYVIIVTSAKDVKKILVPKQATNARFNELSSNTMYEVTIIGKTISGFNVNGTSSIRCSTNVTKSLENEEGGLSVIGIDIDKIRVIWRITKGLNEQPIGYGVSHESEGEPAGYKVIFQRASLNYTIINLKQNTRYRITVTVFTKESGQIIKEEKYAKTKRLIYLPNSPIRNLSTIKVGWNSVTLGWMPPFNYTEPTVIYQIKCTTQNYKRIQETSLTEIKLDNLIEDRQYEIEVKVGAKDIGYYKDAMKVTFNTLVRFPAPVGTKVIALQWDMAKISWQPISRSENIIYKFEFHSELNAVKVRSIQTANAYLKLNNLEQEMGYFFTIRSGNGTIFGNHFSTKEFFATPDRNECLDGSHSCSMHEICMNKKGSYECHCKKGYFKVGKICKPMSKTEPRCGKEISRNIEWRETQNGQTAHSNCPKGTNGISSRYCMKVNITSAEWMAADLSNCVSTWLNDFSYQLRSKTKNSSELMKTLNNEYSGHDQHVGGDIKNVVTMMGDIVHITKQEKMREKELKSIALNLVSLTDNLLSANTLTTWNDLPKEKQTKSAGGILKNIESMANLYRSSSNKTSLVVATQNAVMEVRRLNNISALHFESDFKDAKSAISIPQSVSKFNDAVYFGSFKSIEHFLGTEAEKELVSRDNGHLHDNRISNVIAATLFPQSLARFKQPVEIIHKISQTNKTETRQCVFWNFSSNNQIGSWSKNGCRLHSNNKTHVICHCFHLTNFAVLMSVTKAPLEMEVTHADAMSLITKICIGVSLAALLISFITFCSIRAIKSERNTTHKCLVAALFMAQLLFLFGIDKTLNVLVCRLIAIGLHYLFLVAFTLMGMEGFVLYLMLIKVYKRNNGFGHGKLLLGCWILPVIVVGVTAAVDLKAYGNPKYCWINPIRGFIWSFVGPVIFVIAFNCVIMFLAIKVMKKKAKKRDMISEELWYWIKCLSMLVSILGLAWIIGLFYINKDSIVMAYIFSIVNASQGLAIFIFLCLLDQRIQEFYCKILCCSTRGGYYPNTSRSITATKSTGPSHQQREVNQNSVPKIREEIKPLRMSEVSMEDQEIIVEFAEDETRAV